MQRWPPSNIPLCNGENREVRQLTHLKKIPFVILDFFTILAYPMLSQPCSCNFFQGEMDYLVELDSTGQDLSKSDFFEILPIYFGLCQNFGPFFRTNLLLEFQEAVRACAMGRSSIPGTFPIYIVLCVLRGCRPLFILLLFHSVA